MNNKSVLQIILKTLCNHILILLQLLILSNGILHAQWIQVNVPFTGGADCLTPIGTNIFSFLIITDCQANWYGPAWKSISPRKTYSDSSLIQSARHLIALKHYKDWGIYHDLLGSEKNIHFNRFVESPFTKTKFLVFSRYGIDPHPSFLVCVFDDSLLELSIDKSTDMFLNNRLISEPKYDRTKFIEFISFYNELLVFDYDHRIILNNWKDIKYAEGDTISNELKRLIRPLSVDTDGNAIKVKIYVWQRYKRDLIEMIFVYRNGQFIVTSKLLGKFGERTARV